VLKGFTIVHKTLFSGSWDEKLEKFFDAMTKYRHPGYQSYLVGGGQSARLRINVAFFDRMKWYLAILLKSRIWHFKKMVSDHSIEVYVEKLKAHGMNRL